MGTPPTGTGERELQELLDTRARADHFYDTQVLDHLNDEMQSFVTRQDLCFISTAGADGSCDCSLRAGPAGFVRVLGPRTLAYPEYRGNGVMASLGNIRETGHVGLLLVDFVRDVIGLHVNGRARVVDDVALRADVPDLAEDPHPGRRPVVWVVVEVDEAYVHCSKHIPLMVPLPKQQHWGTDDHKRKGGDFFHAAGQRSAGAPAR
jgi:predicted pyridoxine 5'-phosphate oxidase superfamily flavin-nucleotide-binding protein